MNDETKAKIEKLVQSKKIFLFMKGTPKAPECGFSAQVVQVLGDLGADYETYNIFESEEIRQGIKEYSNWPTIPQLYIDGKFIGGCDIVTEMANSGDLKKLF